MGRAVFKYPFKLETHLTIEMPMFAKILHFGNQGELPTLWAEVNPEAPTEVRHFCILGTGHVIPENTKEVYIGTALFANGTFVWHLYEVQP